MAWLDYPTSRFERIKRASTKKGEIKPVDHPHPGHMIRLYTPFTSPHLADRLVIIFTGKSNSRGRVTGRLRAGGQSTLVGTERARGQKEHSIDQFGGASVEVLPPSSHARVVKTGIIDIGRARDVDGHFGRGSPRTRCMCSSLAPFTITLNFGLLKVIV
jgi:hypothetical protein